MGVAVLTGSAPPKTKPEDLVAALDAPLRDQVGDFRLLRIDRTTLQGVPTVLIYVAGRSRSNDIYGLILFTIVKPRLYGLIGVTALHSTQLAAETRLLQTILLTFRAK